MTTTVTITGTNIRDETGIPDNRPWTAWSAAYRDGGGGGVITPKQSQPQRPVSGVLTLELEPGPAWIQNPDGARYYVTIPNSDASLWSVLSTAVAVPPDTTAQMLAAAVATFVAGNPGYPWTGLAGRPSTLAAGPNNANGYPALDGSGKIGSAQLPSYVDDVLDYANRAAFPATGETGKIYLADDTGHSWRWSGSTYVDLGADVTAALAGKVAKVPAATGVSATDAAALSAGLTNSMVRAEDGTYSVTKNGVTVPASKQLGMGKGSKVQLATGELDSGAVGRTAVVRLVDGSTFIGEVDGNRGNQSKTAFNAANGFSGGIYHTGISAEGTSSAPLRNLWVDAVVKGVADTPLRFDYVNDSYIRIRASDCGGGVAFYNCNNLTVDIEVDDQDNAGWKIFPHGIDFFGCTSIRGRLVVRGQKGTGTVAGGSALSDWITGVVMVDCHHMDFDEIDCEFTSATAQTRGLGVSLLNVTNIHCSKTRIVGYSDGLLELGGVINSTFAGLALDGRYAVASPNNGAGYGIRIYNNGEPSDFSGRTLQYSRNIKFLGGTVRRCLVAAAEINEAVDTTWIGVELSGSWHGLSLQKVANAVGDGPAQAAGGVLRNHKFIGCDFVFNERAGAQIYDAVDAAFVGCRFSNNSQAVPYGQTRRGLVVDTPNTAGVYTRSSTNKTGLVFANCVADDTQGSTGPGFLDPTRPTIVAVDRPELYGIGQTITIAGVGSAGATLTTRVNDIIGDELTLADAMTTFPTVTLTGTIGVTGTAVVGTGTVFNTDLTGRAFVKVGSDYRRIAKVADDTHATVAAAFPANVAAGTTLVIPRATITTVHTQCNGYNFSADTISPVLDTRVPVGNTNLPVWDQTVAGSPIRYSVTTDDIKTVVRRTTVSVTSAVTLGASGDYLVRIGASGAPTLPTAVGNASLYRLKNVDTVSHAVATTSAQTIDGGTLTIPSGAEVDVYSNGTNWEIGSTYKYPAAAVAASGDAARIFASGESNMNRLNASATATIANGQLRVGYFNAMVTESINNVRTVVGATPAVGASKGRIGIYSVDASDNLVALLASTANDVNLWATANAPVTKALSSTFSKVAGTRYAVAMFSDGTSQAPVVQAASGVSATEASALPRLCGGVSGQTDLPTSMTSAALGTTSIVPYFVLTP